METKERKTKTTAEAVKECDRLAAEFTATFDLLQKNALKALKADLNRGVNPLNTKHTKKATK